MITEFQPRGLQDGECFTIPDALLMLSNDRKQVKATRSVQQTQLIYTRNPVLQFAQLLY